MHWTSLYRPRHARDIWWLLNGAVRILLESFFVLLAATAETLFLATINSDTIAVSDDQVIVFNSAPINPGGHYNTESGGYTVPFSGYYQYGWWIFDTFR